MPKKFDKIVRYRTGKKVLGFNGTAAQESNSKILHQVEPEDLAHFGLIPEFICRLPVISVLDELSEDDLVHVLQKITFVGRCEVRDYRRCDFRDC